MTPPSTTNNSRYKEFPPRWRNQSIPTSSKAAALAGLSTYAATRPLGLLVQRTYWAAVTAFGPSILPSMSHPLEMPMTIDVQQHLFQELRKKVGKFDELSVHRQRGEGRKGFALLLIHQGSPQAFVKMRPASDSGSLRTEDEALSLVSKFKPTSFSAPATLVRGEQLGWCYLAMQPHTARIHTRPKKPPLDAITEEIRAALSSLSRPATVPDDWLPMHGDLTPWNLREVGNRLSLFDWEDAGWGPPGSDQTLYLLTARRLGIKTSANINPEAVEFWIRDGKVEPFERELSY